MAETPVTIKLGGQTFVRTSDMKVVTLNKAVLLTTPLTLHEDDGTDYQVPTGKVFKILEVFFGNVTTTKIYTLITATVADSTTGQVDLLIFEAAASIPNAPVYNVNLDCAVDLFPGVIASSETGSESIVVTGIEMDA